MLPECCNPGEVREANPAIAIPTGKRPRGRPRSTKWRDYTSDLVWPRLGVEPAELSEIAENREAFQLPLGLLPR